MLCMEYKMYQTGMAKKQIGRANEHAQVWTRQLF